MGHKEGIMLNYGAKVEMLRSAAEGNHYSLGFVLNKFFFCPGR